MFGNRLGWGISAVIVLFAAFLAKLIYSAGLPTPPTGWVQKAVQPLTAPAGTDAVVPGGMNEARDAGELYRRLIDDYEMNTAAYAAIAAAKELDPAAIAARPGLQALLDATHCQTMTLFANKPEEIINYDAEKPALEALREAAKAATRTALLLGTRDPAAAAKVYEAVFALGAKLYHERVVFDELSKGEDLMGTAAAALQRLAERTKDAERAKALQQFNTDRLNDYEAKVKPVWDVVSSADEGIIAGYAGDIFVLAQDRTIEKMWRVEATLKLGRMLYMAGRRGDQLAAKRVLREMSADTSEDPAVRTAADQARNLTIQQYRTLR
ncbi:MAG TPA: hypothetical protein VLI90_03950 [Tepidisphaeraceae bacterium]|nr:hypothetical protein [Tepidisphaeraceae bacterium]